MKSWRNNRGFTVEISGRKMRVTAKMQRRLPVQVIDQLRAGTAKSVVKSIGGNGA